MSDQLEILSEFKPIEVDPIDVIPITSVDETDVLVITGLETSLQAHRPVNHERVLGHTGLVATLVRKFAGKGVDLKDLTQAATEALLGADSRFDEENGASFKTFAHTTIEGTLKRYLRDRTWDLRVCRNDKDNTLRVIRATSELTAEQGRIPQQADIAERAGLDEQACYDAQKVIASGARKVRSLDTPVTQNSYLTHADSIIDETGIDMADRAVLMDAMGKLDERSRKVLILSFWKGMTQAEIAEEIGVSQVHASRLLRGAISQLRPLLEEGEE